MANENTLYVEINPLQEEQIIKFKENEKLLETRCYLGNLVSTLIKICLNSNYTLIVLIGEEEMLAPYKEDFQNNRSIVMCGREIKIETRKE